MPMPEKYLKNRKEINLYLLGNVPKVFFLFYMWSIVDNDMLTDEKVWLDAEINGQDDKSNALPQKEITARNRYSFRAELFNNNL